ncbi:MAG: hypothetical protein P8M22_02435 [Phycisphaerales bacterium]|nr:hypothetical protein [Phycisphaerales bacterium]
MKTERLIFALVFWILIVIPAPLVLIGLSGDTSLEARVLVPYPSPTWATSYQQQTYQEVSVALEDRMPFRTHLVGFRSNLARKGLIPNPFDKVVIGQGDWLYVATSFDSHCPDDERSLIASRLATIANMLEQNDIRFVVAMVPNKASIHEEGLPAWIRSEHDSAQDRSEAMRMELASEGDWFIDITPAMRARHAASPEEHLYYPTDTHWTWNGAEVLVEAVVQKLQPGLYDPDEIFLNRTISANLDLDRLSGSSVQRDLHYYSARRPGTTDMVLEDPPDSIPAVVTRKHGDAGRLISGDSLIIRDSFWDHAGSVGHEYFEHLVSVHANDARDLQALADALAAADTVIFEAGERKFCEVMLATIADGAFQELLGKALESRGR